MKKLLCLLGIHKWIYGWNHSDQPHALRDCTKCGKKQKHWFKWMPIPMQ